MATDYSEWKQRRNVSVASLRLDSSNPRIPIADGKIGQSELIDYLVENEQVYELAKRIVEKGYSPVETVLGINESTADGKEKLVIVEGNRRVCALKAILSPESVPEKQQKKFRALANNAPLDSLKKINVLVAPSRDAAYPLIMDRHTHNLVHKWSPANKAAFIRQLLDDGSSVAQIAVMGGMTQGEVHESLRGDALYRAACSLDLDEKTSKIVRDPKAFKLSTLQRLFDYKIFRVGFGVDYDSKQMIKGKIKKDEFVKGFKRVVSDIANKEVDSREVKDEKLVQAYLKKIGTDKPDLKKRGRFSISDVIGKDLDTEEPTPKPAKPVRRKSVAKNIIPADLKVSTITKQQRIRDVFNELRNLDLVKNPNASALLFRTLVDLAAYNYVIHKGKLNELMSAVNKQGKKPKDWSPSLRQTLNWILDLSGIDLEVDPQALRAARKFTNEKDGDLCLDDLDKFTHNNYMPPSAEKLRQIWHQIDPLMRVFLTEPK